MDRVLGIDYGDSRVGIALSDPLRIIAKPFKTLTNNSELLSQLRLLIEEQNIIELVVGYPINMKGLKTKQTEKVDIFINILSREFKLKITKIDERLSSVSAKSLLIQQGIKTGHNKSQIDETSAAIILQEFLDKKV